MRLTKGQAQINVATRYATNKKSSSNVVEALSIKRVELYLCKEFTANE